MKTVSIIVPCHNEEENVELFYKETKEKFKSPVKLEFWFIDDGSKDNTLIKLRELKEKHSDEVNYLSFSRNFGKESAIYAGLKKATGDYVALMDADLQDPPEMLNEMYEKLENDKELHAVGARRTTRKNEPPIRSFFSIMFYKIYNKIAQVDLVQGARDYRLMTKYMKESILQLSEYNRFSKTLFMWVGLKTEYLPYENVERQHGETSWNFWGLVKYSIDGIINFSDVPLNIATAGGILSFFLSFLGIAFVVVKTLIYGDPVSGWPSLVSLILFCSGAQLLTIGIIGKYIGKIFMETKQRPIFIEKEENFNIKGK